MVFLSKKKEKKRVRKQPGDEFGVLMIIGSESLLRLKAWIVVQEANMSMNKD